MTASDHRAVDRWSIPTAVYAALDALDGLPALAPDALLLVDDALPERSRPHAGQVVPLAADDFQAAMSTAREAIVTCPDTQIVAAGGGTVLDAVRLAELAVRDPAFADAMDRAVPGPLIWPSAEPSPVIAIPTTIGTAAEVSPVALLPEATMVVSPALRCRAAFLDPRMTGSLDRARQGAGLVEPFARAVVPAIAGSPLLLQDQLAKAHADALIGLGQEFTAGPVSDSWLLAAALTSTSTHTAFLALGRSPAGHVLWPFATELMRLTGLDKAGALARILPAWLDLVATGEAGPAFGTPQRVRTILAGHPPLRAWLAGLGLDTTAPDADAGQLAEQVRLVWQGPLFLSAVPAADIERMAQAICD